ncbi:polysaccharide deacetylase family protein [Halopenitus persicus]|uniref:polysaccharide deacetylase family protein n=1 Tax=Halopenitus persicus TaxID=1048396 RepID=UPI000BBA5934|nr:polysaccharide deacetylase family protein [Halopenitus persicus]
MSDRRTGGRDDDDASSDGADLHDGADAHDRAVLSIDVELFRHTPAFRNAAGALADPSLGLAGARFLQEAFTRHDAATTAFVVSEIADEHPDAVAAFADAGHEIGSHTHTHRLLTDLSPDRRREEIARSKERLEAVTGTDVSGFRAPAFDFGPDHFNQLAAAGYDYDASVVSCRWIPGWYGGEYDLHRPAIATAVDPDAPGGITEVPTAVFPGIGLPLTGTWLRFFGVRYTIWGMRLLARRGIAPVLYVHPWELVDLPDVDGVPARVTVRTGDWMRRAVDRILGTDFEFVTIRDVLADAGFDADRERDPNEVA